jgi:glycosyltransferase involved in cell wall biosynthesis
MDTKFISVVIPTLNRRALLAKVLTALEGQSYPKDSYEVIVVVDSTTDDTPQLLAGLHLDCRMQYAIQENSGAAAARNHGVRLAQGDLILFLDDDMVAVPQLLAEHAARHDDTEWRAVLGRCPLLLEANPSLYRIGLRYWWENLYYAQSRSDHRFTYRDFCTGNVSVPRDALIEAGLFDTSFRSYGGEDYELGYRLLKAGVVFKANPRAISLHHDKTDLQRSFRRVRQEAAADFIIARKHRELIPSLRLADYHAKISRRRTRLRQLALSNPKAGERLAARLQHWLPRYEALRLRTRWFDLYGDLSDFYYWRGIADVLGDVKRLDAFAASYHRHLPSSSANARLDIDLRHGVPDRVYANSRTDVVFNYNDTPLLQQQWNAEELGDLSRYIPRAISQELAWPMMHAFLSNKVIGVPEFWAANQGTGSTNDE